MLRSGCIEKFAQAASDAAGFACEGPSKTQQNFAEDCDINTIVNRFLKNKILPPVAQTASYGDFTGISSYHDALIKVQAARDMFASLPAKVRKRFNNDPGQYLDFFKDPDNIKEAVNLGLLNIDPVEVAAARAQAHAEAVANSTPPQAVPAPAQAGAPTSST